MVNCDESVGNFKLDKGEYVETRFKGLDFISFDKVVASKKRKIDRNEEEEKKRKIDSNEDSEKENGSQKGSEKENGSQEGGEGEYQEGGVEENGYQEIVEIDMD